MSRSIRPKPPAKSTGSRLADLAPEIELVADGNRVLLLGSCAHCHCPVYSGETAFFGGSQVFCMRECLSRALTLGEAKATEGVSPC